MSIEICRARRSCVWSLALIACAAMAARGQEANQSRATIIRSDSQKSSEAPATNAQTPPAQSTATQSSSANGPDQSVAKIQFVKPENDANTLPPIVSPEYANPIQYSNTFGELRSSLTSRRDRREMPNSYFDPLVGLASYQQDDRQGTSSMPRIFYGPPPPVSVDPSFNSPSGGSEPEVREARAQITRQVPVTIPAISENMDLPQLGSSAEAYQPPRPDFTQEPSLNDVITSNVPPPPSGYRLKLNDESSDTIGSRSTSRLPVFGWLRQDDSTAKPKGPVPRDSLQDAEELPDFDDRDRWFNQPQSADSVSFASAGGACDLECRVNCSPLFYSFLWGGYQSMRDLTTSLADPLDPRGEFRFDNGVAAGTGIGIYHGLNWRADFELAFRSNPLDSFYIQRNAGAPPTENFPLDGHLKTYAGMSNFYWDFTRFRSPRVKPYLGVGVGFVFFDPDVHAVGRPILDPRFDEDSSFAYQWMAGLNAALNDQFDLYCEYRFFAADSFRMNANVQSISGSGADPSSLWGDFDYRSQNILMGLRYKF